jgi:hypothetical protein
MIKLKRRKRNNKHCGISESIRNILKPQLYKEQEGRCAVCKYHFELKLLYLDHCHITDTIRGLVCHSCNLMIGAYESRRFGEKTLAKIEQIKEYLELSRI